MCLHCADALLGSTTSSGTRARQPRLRSRSGRWTSCASARQQIRTARRRSACRGALCLITAHSLHQDDDEEDEDHDDHDDDTHEDKDADGQPDATQRPQRQKKDARAALKEKKRDD